MTLHNVVATGPNDPTYQISVDAWNAAHTRNYFKSIVTVFAHATQRVVNHDLGAIPDIISIKATNAEGTLHYETDLTITQLTINLPASQEVDCNFLLFLEVL